MLLQYIQEGEKDRKESSKTIYKALTNKKRHKQAFYVGDQLMFFIHKTRIPISNFQKLSPKKFISFKIINNINDNMYVIYLSGNWRISKTFNVADVVKYFFEDDPLCFDDSRASILYARENGVHENP